MELQQHTSTISKTLIAGRLPVKRAQSMACMAGQMLLRVPWPHASRCSSWEPMRPAAGACHPTCSHPRSRTSTCELWACQDIYVSVTAASERSPC